jgi:hypothetical protein
MGQEIESATEIDIARRADLIFGPRSTADRGMGIVIEHGSHETREPRHV